MSNFTAEDFNEWLNENGFSITYLSDCLGVSKDLLYKYKSGYCKIPIKFKYALDGFLVKKINDYTGQIYEKNN